MTVGVLGLLCVVVGLVLIIGAGFAGRSTRGRAAWTPYNKVSAGLAGVVAIVVGVLLLTGGVN
ncbi:hypothetical protein FHU33_2932 [Blastococcus colisei]|uniref:Uncharacterized protein n=1 Tax=Blastococcus colisei TaxID=1564162 RepID=A0A543PHE1_9ACTN|nr:hypothetical protein [Blastococcus colisei]TQN43485.1 hypothetical protein FHU33_2932 [Blastococcus colisei]